MAVAVLRSQGDLEVTDDGAVGPGPLLSDCLVERRNEVHVEAKALTDARGVLAQAHRVQGPVGAQVGTLLVHVLQVGGPGAAHLVLQLAAVVAQLPELELRGQFRTGAREGGLLVNGKLKISLLATLGRGTKNNKL